MRVVALREYEHVDLDPAYILTTDHQLDVNPELDHLDAFSIQLSKGRLRLQARSMVGLVPLNPNLVLQIRPRVDIANLTHMVNVTGHDRTVLRAFRDYDGHGSASDWIMDLYAESLLDQMDDLLNRGMYRTYRRREGTGSYPAGSLDFTRTVNRHLPRRDTVVAYRWFERSPDTPVNRCLKAGLQAVRAHLLRGRQQRGYRRMVTRAAAQLNVLADVAEDPALGFLLDPEVAGIRALPEPRAYYRAALDISTAVLHLRGLDLHLAKSGEMRLPSLLIETNKLFENYVRLALRGEAIRRGWNVQVIDGNKDGRLPLYQYPELGRWDYDDTTGLAARPSDRHTGDVTPDIVFKMPDGSVPLVAEVKNTVKGTGAPDRDEVAQAVVYAVRYGLDKVLLVHPMTSQAPGLSYCGRIGDIDVYDARVDLTSADMQGSITTFADAVASLLPSAAITAPA